MDTLLPVGPQPEPLENGDRLPAREFLRRYEAMPGIKKAELIEGMVYLGSPVRMSLPAEPDGLVHAWLSHYAIPTAGTRFAPNVTVRLDWVRLAGDRYTPVAADERGLVRSAIFPGLVFDPGALLALDGARVLQTLEGGLASPEHAAVVQG